MLRMDAYEAIKTVGKLSSLQEDETRYYATAVIENEQTITLKRATVAWPKESLESWLSQRRKPDGLRKTAASGNYTLPDNIRRQHALMIAGQLPGARLMDALAIRLFGLAVK